MELDELEDVPEPGLAKVITRAYQTDTYLSSKASTVVAEANGQVVGVVFGYPSENEDDINNVLINLSKRVLILKPHTFPIPRPIPMSGTWIQLPSILTGRAMGLAASCLLLFPEWL